MANERRLSSNHKGTLVVLLEGYLRALINIRYILGEWGGGMRGESRVRCVVRVCV